MGFSLMPFELVITSKADSELHALYRRHNAWAQRTLGAERGRAYLRELKESFRSLCADVVKRPLWYPLLRDPKLELLGFRRFLVSQVLACVFRIQDGKVVVEHIFDARSDYLNLLIDAEDQA